MIAGKLMQLKVITDFNRRVVCLLLPGFNFSDALRDKIWQRFNEKGDTLSMADLKQQFPDEEKVQSPAGETDEMFIHKKDK
jgi:hypothetical protein